LRTGGYGTNLRSTDPGRGIVELLQRREQLGRLPGAVEPGHAARLDGGVAEALADEVLAHLEVEAEQALEQLDERRLLAPALLEGLAQLGQRRQHGGARGVHHVLGV